ncbi:transcriptional repressor [Phytohabitans flavus]|uniref:Transcriptional repressor n=1 Tax=Phytohabitans flavus TaxID=1076124 RepID=A0A6F8XTQ9_9ACTN|nr:Fur family transcriptional regulator [Phytohabitans flavus]BCB77177.1 transcriptional repressor [Phytohabitans flavus]
MTRTVTRRETAFDPAARAVWAWTKLDAIGSRHTIARSLVIDILAAVDGHLSVTEIHERVAATRPEINLSTVHRTVTFLVEHGVAHVLPWPGEGRYGLNDHPHHHAVCDTCGSISEIDAETLSTAVSAAEESSGFTLGDAGVALFGRCPACRGETRH